MRRAITLIELLVVIFIMVVITAIAIPVMIPSIESRRLRETSRIITSHFQGARTRAIQTGHNFGVMIEPQAGLTSAGITLSYMEEAEPWSGETVNSRARIIGNPTAFPPGPNGTFYGYLPDNDPTNPGFIDNSTGFASGETGWMGLVRPGDTLKIGTGEYQISSGEPFTDLNGNGTWNSGEPFLDLYNADPMNPGYDGPKLAKGTINALPWTLARTSPGGTPIPTMVFNDMDMDGMQDSGEQWHRAAFTVLRQPTKTAAHPVQLPNAMVVDLAYSGTGGLPSLSGRGPITVLFTPTGALKSIHFVQNNMAQFIAPSSPLFLLVGKVEKVGTVEDYQDQGNFWVTIHPLTGMITSAEVGEDVGETYADVNGNGQFDGSEAFSDRNLNGNWDGPDGTIDLMESRFLAEQAMTLGGR